MFYRWLKLASFFAVKLCCPGTRPFTDIKKLIIRKTICNLVYHNFVELV